MELSKQEYYKDDKLLKTVWRDSNGLVHRDNNKPAVQKIYDDFVKDNGHYIEHRDIIKQIWDHYKHLVN